MKKINSSILSIAIILVVATVGMATDLKGKKILFIDSYHEGYAWSDGITEGIQSAVESSGVELKVIRMDTKRNPSNEFKAQAALEAKAVIDSFKPDVVIAADDNASKFLVMPYFKNASLPFVFCGVNWDATGYGYPYKNATGMVEVTPIPQLIEQLVPFAKGKKIGFLAPEILTAKKEVENWKKAFGIEAETFFAKSFEEWKEGFKLLQEKADVIILGSDGGLYKDNASDMKAFVEANTQKPTGSSYDFMAPYALITFAKVAQEQGQWSGETALKILSGSAPDTIPVVKNEQGQLIINLRIAKSIGAEISYDILASADRVIE